MFNPVRRPLVTLRLLAYLKSLIRGNHSKPALFIVVKPWLGDLNSSNSPIGSETCVLIQGVKRPWNLVGH